MKKLIHFLSAFSALLFFGAAAHAQSYANYNPDEYMIIHSAPRQTQMVKFYKPTQTYYGKGYVIRYGYKTTTPEAAGFITTDARVRVSADLYLPSTNSDQRRDVTMLSKTAAPAPAPAAVPAPKAEQPAKPEPQPAAQTKVEKPAN